MLRKLQIIGPDKDLCNSISSVVSCVLPSQQTAFLAFLEQEEGYLFAATRLAAEQRKAIADEVRAEKKAAKDIATVTEKQQQKIDRALQTETVQKTLQELNA